jgi:hypothetical protein
MAIWVTGGVAFEKSTATMMVFMAFCLYHP